MIFYDMDEVIMLLTSMVLKNEWGNYALTATVWCWKIEWGNYVFACYDFWKIEWGNYVLILLIKMQQSTILKKTFSDCYGAYLWINIELLYCSDISFENFCQSVFFTLFPLGDVTVS